MLTQKENALRAILRTERPEWVPVLADCTEIIIPGPMRENPPFGESGKDWFGCEWIWEPESCSHAPELHKPPLIEDITEWRDVLKIPDLDAIDWEAAAKKDLENVDRENKIVRLFCVYGPFERANILLGMENGLIAMLEEPEEYKALIEALGDYKVKLIDKLLTYYRADEVFFHDDLGGSSGPMMSLDMYRELIKPTHKRIADTIHRHHAIYTHHSCGCMEQFIPDLIDNGAQMLNPIQPMNHWKDIVEKYSDQVSFDIGAEIHANLPDTTKEQLIEDTHYVIDTFAPKGNFIFECYISNAKCFGNADIMNDEARRYGKDFYCS